MSDELKPQEYPNRECPTCSNGESLTFPPVSSIVGNGPVHHPSGHVCMKYVAQVMYDFYLKQKTAKESK
jgi:hypothetical protein